LFAKARLNEERTPLSETIFVQNSFYEITNKNIIKKLQQNERLNEERIPLSETFFHGKSLSKN